MGGLKVFIAMEPCDMRKGFDGLPAAGFQLFACRQTATAKPGQEIFGITGFNTIPAELIEG